ncbi:MAG: insulinase family protein [Bdellovibrionota bacterium]
MRFRNSTIFYQLSNGLKVILLPLDNHNSVAFDICYHAGSRHDDPYCTGSAHFCEHLMFTGTNTNNKRFSANFPTSGFECNATTSKDRTHYFSSLFQGSLERLIYLEADRLKNLSTAINDNKIAVEKSIIINEWSEKHGRSLNTSVYDQINKYICRGTFYEWPILGWKKDIQAMSGSDIMSFIHNYYNVKNCSICIVGGFKSENATSWIEQYFGSISQATNPSNNLASEIFTYNNLTSNEQLEIKADSRFQYLILTWSIPTQLINQSIAMDVLCSLLGDQSTGILQKKLLSSNLEIRQISVEHSLREYNSQFQINICHKSRKDSEEIIHRVFNLLNEAMDNMFNDHEIQSFIDKYLIKKYLQMSAIAHQEGLASALNRYQSLTGSWKNFFHHLDNTYSINRAQINFLLKSFISNPYLMTKVGKVKKTTCFSPKTLPTKKSKSTSLIQQEPTSNNLPDINSNTLHQYPQLIYSEHTKKVKSFTVKRYDFPISALTITASKGWVNMDNLCDSARFFEAVSNPRLSGKNNPISRSLNKFAININLTIKPHTMNYSILMHQKYTDHFLEIFANYTSYTPNKSILLKWKNKFTLDSIQVTQQPKFIAHTIMNKLMFENSPLTKGPYPNPSSLEKFDLSSYRRWQQLFFESKQIEFFAIGERPESLTASLSSYFENKFKENTENESNTNIFKDNRKNLESSKRKYKLAFVYRPKILQTTLLLGWKLPLQDLLSQLALDMLLEMLANSNNSTLNNILGKRNGLTYKVNGHCRQLRENVQILIESQVKNDSIDVTIKLILDQINALSDISEGVLKNVKESYLYKYRSGFSSYDETLEWIQRYVPFSNNLTLYEIENFIEYIDLMIQKVDNSHILTSAKYLQRCLYFVIITPDKGKIQKGFINNDLFSCQKVELDSDLILHEI